MSAGVEIRRRRDAALRCVPFEDCVSDPLDRIEVTYSRAGIEAAAAHLKAVGLYDEFLAGLLRDQWQAAVA